MRFLNLYKSLLPALIVFLLLFISCNNPDKETKPSTASDSSKDPAKESGTSKSIDAPAVQVIDEHLYTLYISVDTLVKYKARVMFNFYVDSSSRLTLRGWKIPLKTDTAQPGGKPQWDMAIGPDAGIVLDKDMHIGSMFLKRYQKILSSMTATTKYIVFAPRIASGNFGRTLLYDIMLSDSIPSLPLVQPGQTLMMLNPSPPYGFQ